ncbi:MAG: NEW3 domain-containing protein, partial [Actinomycetota bacterium]|nr:NEW3 domain-containing protein [Actinomycetota bacterium]
PCAVPGAMPVSEVGDAVIGRGFGLTHDRGASTAVDSAKYPSTLDNPAYGWFGLSSMVRVRFADGSVRAISVAEVVSPGGDADPLVRDLMVALARAGVTATCTGAASARYGDLTVDSNLPDVRISVGGPDANAFTAAVLGTSTVAAERTWVPAAKPLKAVWLPGADLRDVHALPVLVVDVAAVAALVEDLATAEIVVDQQGPADLDPFESRTVAVFNRGVPGFAVDPDGTLHTSLMRSCTGWPSGTWIDPPRRTAPDGSNFQLQHWTHTFDYALACGSGDWRDAEMVSRSAEFNQPLHVVAADHDPASGGLPAWGSLLEIEPARDVALGALKLIGNPIAGGSGRRATAEDGIALRLVETRGRTADVVIRSGLRNVSSPQRLDLLERPLADQQGGLRLHGYEIATFGARLNLPRVVDAGEATLAPDAEPAQPLYARYWLHNRGPAPLGGLPAVAHLHPHQLAVDPGGPVQLQLTAVSDVTDVALHGKVRLIAPPGWTVAMDELAFMLPPGDFLESIVDLTMPPGTAPGLYPLRAELGLTGSALPPSWRQVVEDVCVIAVGATDDRVIRMVADPEPVEVAAGDTARLSVTVGTDCHTDLAVEAHLISPWGTWEWLTPNIIGADLPARGTVELSFDVVPPAWTEPGEWWALIRVACAGELLYSPAVKVVVRR